MTESDYQFVAAMAAAIVRHLRPAEAMFVADCCAQQPARMMAYFNIGPSKQTPKAFAQFALECAKRVAAGPTA